MNNKTIKNIVTSGEIAGNSNVGGLIGVAENVIIEFCLVDGNITSESKRQEELSILNNYTIGKGVTDYAIGNYTDNMDESTYDSGSLNQDFYSSYETVHVIFTPSGEISVIDIPEKSKPEIKLESSEA